MNSSGESAAREQWMLDTVREIADKFAHDRDQGKVRSMLYPIIARHYAAREREEWIPVSERLPEDGTSAIVFVPGWEEAYLLNRVAWVDYDVTPPQWVSPGEIVDGVTHWRPLPAAPFAAKGETDRMAAQGEQHD